MKVVENAIIVPIFTMIIIALISVGIYMHDRIIIRNMVSQISIEYEKESDITARKELIKRGERYAADRTMFLRDINIYDDRVYQQDESIVCSASFPVIGSYAGMSDICNISENVNKIDNARLIRKTNALMELVQSLAEEAGLTCKAVYQAFTREPVKPDNERIYYIFQN